MKTSFTLDLQPMSLGDILDRTIRLYRRHFLHALAIVGLPYLLIIPGMAILGSGFVGRGRPLAWQNPVLIVGGVVFGLVYLCLIFMSMGAMARYVSERYLGGTPTIWTSYSPVLRQFLSLVWAYLLASFAGVGVCATGGVLFGLGIFVANGFPIISGYVIAAILGAGSLVAIFFGVRIFLRSFLITQIVVLEGVGGWGALKRSWKLMAPSVGRAGLILLFVFAVNFVVSFLFGVPAGIVVALHPGWPAFVLSRILNGIGQILSAPLGLIAFTLLYYDCRIRQEAFDLEMMAQDLGVSTSPSAPSESPTSSSEGPPSFSEIATPTPPTPPEEAASAPADARPFDPPRPSGAFKVCPKCGAQVPNIQPSCGTCGTRVPYRPATR